MFTAPLTAAPSSSGRLELGPSTVTSGAPASACSPGAASTVTLKSGSTLRRTINNRSEDTLTYTRTR
ncbi:hypothetical protein ABT040_23750 [Streptomyces sp. NPDC002688]|uniref:hypothetical protein n=1 Tax=Streptomyces sp. NPDC002688 TaxID=3154423 RepID=UPI00332F01CF